MAEGVVLKSTGSWYTVESTEGEIFECRLKGNFKIKGIKTTNPIAVGDKVSFLPIPEVGKGQIEKIFERNNYIIRKSVNLSKQTHIIASNIDQTVLVVTLANPRTSTGFIDRYTVTSEAYHIPVKIVFNKYDLYDEDTKKQLDELICIYEKIGYECLITSAFTGQNTDLFKALLADKTSLLSGHSGVGKSALVNAIEPKLNLKTSVISDFNQKGKHRTTFAQMHKLSFGAYVIDTPGIKEFGIVDFKKEEVAHYFPEMRELMHQCRFNNCTHSNEPGCAVKNNYDKGLISFSRYKNYLNIINNDEAFEPDFTK